MVALLVSVSTEAQDTDASSFDELSIQYRTALYNDPLLNAAMDALVGLYVKADRLDELIGTYKSHIEQYPTDAGAKTVLIRVMQSTNRSGAEELLASAVALHPDFAPLQFLLFEALDAKGDERSLEALSLAIDLESSAERRAEWLELLLERSGLEGRREEAEQQLQKVLQIEGMPYEEALSLARLMQRYEFWEASLEALKLASDGGAEGEALVEIGVQLARALSELNRAEEAGSTLDALLEKLGPEHWRRREIMSMRLNVVSSAEERTRLIENYRGVYEANPGSEGAILDFADVLIAAERQNEATAMLVKAGEDFPASKPIEDKTLELLRASQDMKAYELFLADRLEINPERRDLRLELVKVRYGLNKDADAEQDFQAVVAGLSPEDSSQEILELQRYLRGIDRKDAATPYLRQYLKQYPERVDVARELLEIYISSESRSEAEQLIGAIDPVSATSENVLDLIEHLLSVGMYEGARAVIVKRITENPDDFTLGVMLIRALGELGDLSAADRQITLLRGKADSPAQYARWLEAAMQANTRLEALTGFLDTEQNRFSFSEDEWPESKVEKFLILCEAAKTRLSTERIASAIRERLTINGIEGELRIRLQRFLLGILEFDPNSSSEVETLLVDLAKSRPELAPEYNLRRALLYHRTQQVTQAQELIESIVAAQVSSANPLREGVEALLEYRFLEKADEFLSVINILEPEDIFSWSRRLSLLATRGEEAQFREVSRSLIRGDVGVRLLPESIDRLNEQLVSSYWRSLSRLFSSSRYGEVLPLLTAVEREVQPTEQRAWMEWTRFVTLAKLGRTAEAEDARGRFLALVEEGELEEVRFPDGLALNPDAVKSDSNSVVSPSLSGSPDTGFLIQGAQLKWGFELPENSRIQTFWKGNGRVLVVDEFNGVYGIDSVDGKLLWTHLSKSERGGFRGRPVAFRNSPLNEGSNKNLVTGDRARVAQGFAARGGRFFLIEDENLNCYSTKDGMPVWSAELPFDLDAASGGLKDILAVSDELIVVFRPDRQMAAGYEIGGGKLRWQHSGDRSGEEAFSRVDTLNSGAQVANGRVLLYGKRTEILDASSGTQIWNLDPGDFALLPVELRRDRGEPEEPLSEEEVKAENESDPVAFDVVTSTKELSERLFFEERQAGTILSPAAFWAYRRSVSTVPAFAHLGASSLWLGYESTIRKIPIDIPIGSAQLDGGGAFLGETGSHAWFVDRGYLHHADFTNRRTYLTAVNDLGNPVSIRALLSGNQVIVKGDLGLKLVNALTGEIVGQTKWSSDAVSYLNSAGVNLPTADHENLMIWQGRVIKSGPNASLLCRPVNDVLDDGAYLTSFDERVVICLGAGQDTESVGEQGE